MRLNGLCPRCGRPLVDYNDTITRIDEETIQNARTCRACLHKFIETYTMTQVEVLSPDGSSLATYQIEAKPVFKSLIQHLGD